MNYNKIHVNGYDFYIGFNNQGYTFIGTPNGDKTEIEAWFKSPTLAVDPHNTIKDALNKYLNGEVADITIPIDMIGTEFQTSVWQELLKIPYGTLVTYEEIATHLGDKKKVRAVATAIAKNPLLMVVPCHRVIGKDGSLRGFRAGLSFKQELIKLEKRPIL